MKWLFAASIWLVFANSLPHRQSNNDTHLTFDQTAARDIHHLFNPWEKRDVSNNYCTGTALTTYEDAYQDALAAVSNHRILLPLSRIRLTILQNVVSRDTCSHQVPDIVHGSEFASVRQDSRPDACPSKHTIHFRSDLRRSYLRTRLWRPQSGRHCKGKVNVQ